LAHVFLKDDEHYFVRLGRLGRIKYDRSLKNYSKDQIDAMIHLRIMEKIVLKHFSRFPHLVYYQPETTRLEEGLRHFHMLPVILDYSHIGPDDPAYYKLPERVVSSNYRMAQEDKIAAIHHGPAYLIVGKTPEHNSLVYPKDSLKRVA